MDTSFFPLEENLTLWLGQRNIKDFLFKVRFLKGKPYQTSELWRNGHFLLSSGRGPHTLAGTEKYQGLSL
jgi:hypothetical protein